MKRKPIGCLAARAIGVPVIATIIAYTTTAGTALGDQPRTVTVTANNVRPGNLFGIHACFATDAQLDHFEELQQTDRYSDRWYDYVEHFGYELEPGAKVRILESMGRIVRVRIVSSTETTPSGGSQVGKVCFAMSPL